MADLFGLVQRFPAFFAGEPLEVKALDASRVRVVGSNNFELSATTDPEGVFSFPTLPAGTYNLDLDPPPPGTSNWHLNRGLPVTVEIGATIAPGCSTTLSFVSAGGIKGRVIDEYEHSLAGSVTLEPAD